MMRRMTRLQELRAHGGLARWEQRTDTLMLGLAVLFVVVLVLPVAVHLRGTQATLIGSANITLWVAFAVDYVARLYLAPARWVFVRTHPIDLLVVAVPFLRPLRVLRALRLLRVGTVTANLFRRGQRPFHTNVAMYVGTSAVILLAVSASAMYGVERDAKGSNIHTFGDALWWAVTTVTTVGYGDRYPTTAAGRSVAAGLMVVGIALLGVVTASVAAWFVAQLQAVEDSEARVEVGFEELMEEIRSMRADLEGLKTHLGQI